MKLPFPRVLPIIVGLLGGLALSVALYALTEGALFENILGRRDGPENPLAADAEDAELVAFAYQILDYLKEGDYNAMAKAAHPEYGVVFSPYATITLSSNKCFQPDQLAQLGRDDTVYVWGVYDGIGEPIELTPADYFARFVFDKNYTKAAVVGVNHIVRSGNALENISETFPDARFVDFHITDSGRESAENLDWSSLRLGFEEYRGELRLTLVLHSEWTI